VQAVVDDKHKLIVASEVVNDSSDVNQLHAMAKATKEVLEAKSLQVLADAGYYSSADLKACEDDGIEAYVPASEGNGMLEKQGRFSLKDFSYDATADAYRCPAGELLRPTKGRFTNTSGRVEIRYLSRKAICGACPLRARCLTPKAAQRSIGRWEHEDVIERHRARMQSADADKLMRRRSGIVEHPFGTLKCRAGYRHFLLRGFNKVRGEWSLMALCYNFTRVLNILGFDRFVAYMAAKTFAVRDYALAAALHCIQLVLGGILDTYRVTARSPPTPTHSSPLTNISRPASSGKSVGGMFELPGHHSAPSALFSYFVHQRPCQAIKEPISSRAKETRHWCASPFLIRMHPKGSHLKILVVPRELHRLEFLCLNIPYNVSFPCNEDPLAFGLDDADLRPGRQFGDLNCGARAKLPNFCVVGKHVGSRHHRLVPRDCRYQSLQGLR
jgi:hypothetical protein